MWRPIETAPTDCTPILAAIPVYKASDGQFTHWEMHVIAFDGEAGELVEDLGWRFQDYHFWQPLPPPPATQADYPLERPLLSQCPDCKSSGPHLFGCPATKTCPVCGYDCAGADSQPVECPNRSYQKVENK